MALTLQICIALFFPWIARILARSGRLGKVLSPVVLCYLAGMLIGNLGLLPVDEKIAGSITEGAIVLAIPLLLFSTRLADIRKFAGPALSSFGWCVLAGLISTSAAAFIFADKIPDTPVIAGMVVGIYTGGTPNMQAIGLALQSARENIIMLNAADILLGGIYLVFLTSVAPLILAKILPSFQGAENSDPGRAPKADQPWHWKHVATGLALSIGVAGAALGLSLLLFGSLNQTSLIILALTSISLALSFIPFVSNLPGTYESGEYLLLIFSVALGMLADFQKILESGGALLGFTTVAMFGNIGLHLLFSRWRKIDRDTFMITSTAAIYGPAFIGQIASVIDNRKLVFAGIGVGLLGYALGNYLGIGLHFVLNWFW